MLGTLLHSYSLTRHIHATQGKDSCGFIGIEADPKNSVSDVVFMEGLTERAPAAATRLKEIAELSMCIPDSRPPPCVPWIVQ